MRGASLPKAFFLRKNLQRKLMPDLPPTPAHYTDRADAFAARARQERRRYNRFSLLRLLTFIAALVLVILLISWQWLTGLIVALVLIIAFARFVRWHQQLLARAEFLEHMARINRAESAALEYDYQHFAAGGPYTDPGHPYSLDLDIFGPYSLFQYLNRSTTAVGAERLARWLQAPAPTNEVQQRQRAVAALAPQVEWRQTLQAIGANLNDELRYRDQLLGWLEAAPVVAGRPWLRRSLWLVPLLMSGVVAGLFLGLPWGVALLFLLVPGLILRQHTEAVNRLHAHTAYAGGVLNRYSALIAHVESADFQEPRLQQLQAAFRGEHAVASTAIRQLAYAISQLDVRYNIFAILLEFSLLWSLQWAYRLDRWKAAHRAALPAWFEALAELEALLSLGNLHYNQPDWCFPALTDAPELTAEALGHPLIRNSIRVTNEIQMPTHGHIHLITGSNMAGKSTWLRTVGINIVLALAGAPVCARQLRLPQLQVYTSMRTQDALHESTSSFFAELKRLKFIIEAVEDPTKTDGRPVFFLLDEILKGTNSRDRHTGAKALIRQLIRSRGAGLIATHDLELAVMENEAGSQVENWAMEVKTSGENLVFDYKLQRGVSQSFNATHLMRAMGIAIPEED